MKSYKKESYSYKTSGDQLVPPEKIRMQNNINQLDSLLDDLQQAKQVSGEQILIFYYYLYNYFYNFDCISLKTKKPSTEKVKV